MNRQEKRKFLKYYGKGLPPAAKSRLLEFEEMRRSQITFEEGEKVKINYEKITSSPDYPNKLQTYKDTVELLKDKECTVVYDKKYGNTPQLVCLKEDTNEVKFLFFVGDLIKI